MYVLAISTITDAGRFWDGLKKLHGSLPAGARWTLAVSSTDGTRAVNVIAHESVDGVRTLFARYAADSAVTEYREADAANAVGLGK